MHNRALQQDLLGINRELQKAISTRMPSTIWRPGTHAWNCMEMYLTAGQQVHAAGQPSPSPAAVYCIPRGSHKCSVESITAAGRLDMG
jgi:hypothetical protein